MPLDVLRSGSATDLQLPAVEDELGGRFCVEFIDIVSVFLVLEGDESCAEEVSEGPVGVPLGVESKNGLEVLLVDCCEFLGEVVG